ncbi:unnamed protein product [Haemonchus placei]|uniref:Pheromone n=1 Tax=Haemonchus placei TaxID=6290 RepID=A0A0N4WPY9_HAEPC|nr:unnamed protein product [Haemonchus placei]
MPALNVTEAVLPVTDDAAESPTCGELAVLLNSFAFPTCVLSVFTSYLSIQ